MKPNEQTLIETNEFPIDFISKVAERESWRKEIHRPIYHIHKWWANRLGSVFRAILLGCVLGDKSNFSNAFYSKHDFSGLSIFDPFMGSGTTVGEAHKLGFNSFGRDINPIAAESVRVALGQLNREKLIDTFSELDSRISKKLKSLYKSKDSSGKECDVLYYFWVMQAECPFCEVKVDLFPSWIIARNAYPSKKPEVQILCPSCGDIFEGINGQEMVKCRSCKHVFAPTEARAKGANGICNHCHKKFPISKSLTKNQIKPVYRLYGKLVLTGEGDKKYLPATKFDLDLFHKSTGELTQAVSNGKIVLPDGKLEPGSNTNQAINYNFKDWKDFFNDRQLLALGILHNSINETQNVEARDALLVLFSGLLEFNNMFASYKGEGTGAVRHMFSHHILKPERTPIEANVWGTNKSSGSFSGLFKTRLLRACDYRSKPTEVSIKKGSVAIVCSTPFQEDRGGGLNKSRGIFLSCGDSAKTEIRTSSIDFVVTDPPFFDNVNYSELADFFYSWQKLTPRGFISAGRSTRSVSEVQDSDPMRFSDKLQAIFLECRRVLKDGGLLVFTYHHSKDEGWTSLAQAILNSGFVVVNAHPVKSEMSTATPKSQAKEPIQIDSIIVCKKASINNIFPSVSESLKVAKDKINRIEKADIALSKNDRKVIIYSQLLTTLKSVKDISSLTSVIGKEVNVTTHFT